MMFRIPIALKTSPEAKKKKEVNIIEWSKQWTKGLYRLS